MPSPLQSSLPLLAGFVYAVSAVFLKRATAEGGGLWRINFLTNWTQALAFLPLIAFGSEMPGLRDAGQIVLTALAFTVGQAVVFVGLRHGDVSVITPVMGVKVLMVAAFAGWVADEKIPKIWWVAAVLSALAAALMGLGAPSDRRRLFIGVICGLGAAAAFALVDVFFQVWAGRLGVWPFSAWVALAMGFLSLPLLPVLEGPWWKVPRPALIAFVPGMAATLGQVVLMAYAVVLLQGAAWANLLYSSRGLWSVLLVWIWGRSLGNAEFEEGGTVLVRRLGGALLMLLAVGLVLYKQG
jgi:drug/metabolite transporter (DMT)-like permease